MGLLIDIIIVTLILFVLITVISMAFYKKCPPGSMMVLFHNKTDAFGNSYKIIKSGGAFIWPIGGSYVIFDLSPFSIDLVIERLTDKDEIPVYLKAKIMLSISSNENTIQNAIERISGLNKEQINEVCLNLIPGQLRALFAGISFDEIKTREKANSKIETWLKEPLENMGIVIINTDIIELKKIEQQNK
jgi:flotillin